MNELNHLEPEELDVLESFEREEWNSVWNREQELQHHRRYAKATLLNQQPLRIRLSSQDWQALQTRALLEGLSYRALASSIIHKYLSGTLVDKSKTA
jgi:predicted DNA binding CopG/RHH family protein